MARRLLVACVLVAAAGLPELGARAALPRPDCDRTQPISAGGLTHFPSGQAEVFVTRQGRLLLTSFGPSGSDGFCTVLPDWNSVSVTEPTPIRLRRNELLVLTFGSRDSRLLSVGIEQRPGDLMRGFMDYTDDSVVIQVELVRNGESVSSHTGTPGAFNLPDMALRGWSFHGVTGVFTLRGTDRDGNQWQLNVSPTSFAGAALRRSSLTLGTTIPDRTLVDGLFGGGE